MYLVPFAGITLISTSTHSTHTNIYYQLFPVSIQSFEIFGLAWEGCPAAFSVSSKSKGWTSDGWAIEFYWPLMSIFQQLHLLHSVMLLPFCHILYSDRYKEPRSTFTTLNSLFLSDNHLPTTPTIFLYRFV